MNSWALITKYCLTIDKSVPLEHCKHRAFNWIYHKIIIKSLWISMN